jgi:hypothetical protein
MEAHIPFHIILANGLNPDDEMSVLELYNMAQVDKSSYLTARTCPVFGACVRGAFQRDLHGFDQTVWDLYPSEDRTAFEVLAASDTSAYRLVSLYESLKSLSCDRPRTAMALGQALCDAVTASLGIDAASGTLPLLPGKGSEEKKASNGNNNNTNTKAAVERRLETIKLLIAMHKYVRFTLGMPRSRVKSIKWAFNIATILAVLAATLPVMGHPLIAGDASFVECLRDKTSEIRRFISLNDRDPRPHVRMLACQVSAIETRTNINKNNIL